jgi:hypothetical protein
MNGNCIDIGTIQAFLDGETTAETSEGISEHIAECTACAKQLATAEDENSFVFSALDREMNTLVPTARLWSRINDSIEVEKAKEPIWKQVYAFVSTAFRSPSFTAAAGLLIVLGFVAVVWTLKSDQTTGDGPIVSSVSQVNPDANATFQPFAGTSGTAPVISNETTGVGPIQVKAGSLTNEKLEKLVRDANARNAIRPITLDYNAPLPGEKSYIKTISDLKQSVDGRKDAVLSGSSRVAFERDLAVVNDGIQRMQKVVRKNPNNQSARQVLYSAYQDKIDLLNTVAQRDELMASIR